MKTVDISETIAASDLKVGRSRHLIIPPAFMPNGIKFSPFRSSVRPFVSSFVRSFIRGICVKVLR